ncbi:uncharacterized protein LOC114307614 [Camellia sinensis]|uniref:uncharacterized protein LOC114307614 n=1 Tax=Camellia sinensis TaxID=4442 RepID=UPI0010369CDC|nr:uncharacterized protein LOC114307614 [Camellia sinensis]
MAQNTEEIAAMMATLRTMDQRLVAQDEVIADLRRPSGASASTVHSVLAAQPNPNLLPPLETPQVPDPRDMFPTASAYRPPIQPPTGTIPFVMNEVNPAMIKIARLEKALKKSQGFNSIPDIEDGYTEASVRLPEKFKMPHIDRFDESEDPIVYVHLFLDVLRPTGLSRAQKLSLFGRTLSDVVAIWYAKLEDSTKRNWEELSEGFVNQYSYNTQIEVTISELEATTQNPKEPFIDFVARWREKATRMTSRPFEKEQVKLVVQNLEPDMLQKMIVAPLSTFASLHELGGQIESTFKKGIIHRTREPAKKPFTRNTNASTSTMPRPTDVSTIATSSAKIVNPFAVATNSQTAQNSQPWNRRPFNPLYMSPTHTLKVLMDKGHLKPLVPRPLPDSLPARHDPT